MHATASYDASWYELEDRRVQREYKTMQGMLDDMWGAQEHGWLPISMLESRRENERRGVLSKFRPKKKKKVYVVAYLHQWR